METDSSPHCSAPLIIASVVVGVARSSFSHDPATVFSPIAAVLALLDCNHNRQPGDLPALSDIFC